MNTKELIIIIDAIRYIDKKTGEIKTRIGFVFGSEKHLKKTDKFVGFSELSCFYDGDLIERIPKEVIMKPIEATFEIRNNQSNPMKSSAILSSYEFKGNVYKLL